MKLNKAKMEEEMRLALIRKKAEKQKRLEAKIEKDRKKLMSRVAKPGQLRRKAIRKPRIHY